LVKTYYYYTFRFPKEFLESSNIDSIPGFLGSEVEEFEDFVEVKAYFSSPVKLNNFLKDFLLSEGFLKESNWESEWKRYFKPTKISDKFWVVPSWMKGKISVQGIPVYIYPARTFGTGTHETTQLAVELMEKVLRRGNSLLDVGSGSGILSIVAKKLGAGKVVACDIQDEALEELRHNEELNCVSGIEFVRGSARDIKGKFDVVVANIEKHLLEPIFKDVVNCGEKFIIISGILQSQEGQFLERAKMLNLNLIEKAYKGDWVSFLFEVSHVR
jgi:ribosomal protein L11 methyltransferase